MGKTAHADVPLTETERDNYKESFLKIPLGEGRLTAYDYMVHFPKKRLDHVEKKLNYPIKYNDYYPSQYSLELMFGNTYWWEVPENLSNSGHFFIHQLVNTMWQFLVLFDLGVISYIESAYSSDIVDSFADTVGGAVRSVAGFSDGKIGSSGVWGELSSFMIVLAGAWAAYMLVIKRATTKAGSGLATTMVVLVLSLALFSNPSGAMRYLNDLSTGLSQEILGVGVELTPPDDPPPIDERLLQRGILPENKPREIPKEAVSFKIADRLYDMMVYEPYLMLQYGKTSKDITPGQAKSILQHKVMGKNRADAVKKEVGDPEKPKNYMMTTAGTFERMAIVILLWGCHIVWGIALLVIAGAILFYQLLFILLTLFAPFALLMALVPTWTHVGINWCQKWVGAIMMKLILSLFLSLVLTLSQVLYKTTPPTEYGYIWTITLQLILIIGILWKRKDLLNIMRAPIRAVDNFPGEASGSMRSLPRRMEYGYRRTKHRTKQAVRTARSAGRGVKRAGRGLKRAYNWVQKKAG